MSHPASDRYTKPFPGDLIYWVGWKDCPGVYLCDLSSDEANVLTHEGLFRARKVNVYHLNEVLEERSRRGRLGT